MNKSNGLLLLIFIMIVAVGTIYMFNNSNDNNLDNNSDNNDDVISEIVDTSHTNSRIVIKLPILGHSKIDEVNKLIEKEVLKSVSNIYGEDYVDLNLELECEKKIDNVDMISLVFTGVGYVEGAAYPNNVFISLNFGTDDLNIIKLTDLYEIDDTFISEFRLATLNLNEDQLLEIDSYTDEDLKAKLSSDLVYSYYTQNNVGISLGVSHVLGDHLEVEINKYAILNNLK